MISIFTIILILAVILAIIFGVIFVVGLLMKITPLKLTGMIGAIIGIALLVFGGIGLGVTKEHQKNEQIRQAKIKKNKDKKFKLAANEFKNIYYAIGLKAEKLGDKELNFWDNAIETSGDNFDVDKVGKDMDTKYGSERDTLYTMQATLNAQVKIMKANNTGKYDLSEYTTAYDKMTKFVSIVHGASGSYNSFLNAFNKNDTIVANQEQKLQTIK